MGIMLLGAYILGYTPIMNQEKAGGDGLDGAVVGGDRVVAERNRVRRYRREGRLTQDQLARLAFVHRSTIVGIEGGDRPTLEVAMQLASVLGCTVDGLFGPPRRLAHYLADGSLDAPGADLLEAALCLHQGIMVAGWTGAGKTVFVDALVDAFERLCGVNHTLAICDPGNEIVTRSRTIKVQLEDVDAVHAVMREHEPAFFIVTDLRMEHAEAVTAIAKADVPIIAERTATSPEQPIGALAHGLVRVFAQEHLNEGVIPVAVQRDSQAIASSCFPVLVMIEQWRDGRHVRVRKHVTPAALAKWLKRQRDQGIDLREVVPTVAESIVDPTDVAHLEKLPDMLLTQVRHEMDLYVSRRQGDVLDADHLDDEE